MLTGLAGLTGTAGVIVALAFMGCVTALAITGHISGTDALVALGVIAGGATAVTAGHVAGSNIARAITTSRPGTQPPPGS